MLLAFAASLPDLKGKEPPKRLLVGKWGKNESVKGPFTINETTARYLPAVQRILGYDTVAIDFQHNSVPGSAEYDKTQEPRKVAGHGVPRVIPGEGLFIEEIRWTPEGEESIRGGHHPDLSPAIKANDNGEVVLLHSAALCRQGSCLDLQVFTAGLTPEKLQLFSATLSDPKLTTEKSKRFSSSNMNYKELLCLILGLDHNSATDAQITEATKTFATRLSSALGQAGTITTLSAEVGTLKTTIGSLQTKLDKNERDTLVREALAAGKLIPHGAEFDAMTNAQFGAVLASLQAGVVPVEKRTPDQVKTFSVEVSRPGEDTAELIRKTAGINKEDWDKHAK